MGTRRLGLLLLLAVMTTVLAGCGVSTNVENAPAPAASKISIAFQSVPPSALQLSGATPLTAVVSSDPSNAGVDWNVTCQAAPNCGSFSSLHTASGQPVTYTSPTTLTTNTQVVSIVAFATADHTKNVASAISITGFSGFLQSGKYVIGTTGADISGLPYQRAGVITLDGNGGVTGGEQTVNFSNPNIGLSSVTDQVTGGSYFVGPDGRGTLTINTGNPNIGQAGIETFSLVVLSVSHVLVTASSGESSVGTLDIQNPQTGTLTLAKGYAFVANGTDLGGSAMAIGGVFNIDSSQTISGAGSVFDEASVVNFGAGNVTPSSSVSGSVSTDASGVFQISLATDFGTVQLNAYPLGDGTHLKIIESDGAVALTVGDAFSQGLATGSFTTPNTFTGKYVFGIFGRDLNGGNASLAAAGLFSTTGAGTLTNGYIDESQVSVPLQIGDSFNASYAVDPASAGTGRFYIPVSAATGSPDVTFADPNNGTGPAWVFYLTGNGGPALMLDADVEPTFASAAFSGGGVGTGMAYPVTAGSSFSGLYGTVFTQNMGNSEDDVVGKFAASGGSLSGVLDINNASGQVATGDTSFSGTYQNSAISNRLTGTLTDAFFVDAQGTSGPSLSTAFYPIDSTQGFFVENDLADGSGNLISGDLTFGYYATRTPICQGCP